jgi:DNA (cytosine-5)-methyltransferase 1
VRLLDLFCGAGGCSMGYHRAGFEVVGVDLHPQKNYPFEFHQADAMTFPLEGFDAIHASPPCQMYSRALKHMAAPQPMLIDAIKERLVNNGAPWIIENVVGAPIPHQTDLFGAHGVMLCGSAFGMRVYRHRLFEASFPLMGRPCSHTRPAMNPHKVKGRELIYEEFGHQDPELPWRRDMGVEWMGRYEAREAIPPAYTEFLGRQLTRETAR